MIFLRFKRVVQSSFMKWCFLTVRKTQKLS